MATKLGAEHVDSFQIMKQSHHVCAFKGCVRAGRVKLFWRENQQASQESSFVCVNHALDLANEVLGVYKFHQGGRK